jgi:hypothetical protein
MELLLSMTVAATVRQRPRQLRLRSIPWRASACSFPQFGALSANRSMMPRAKREPTPAFRWYAWDYFSFPAQGDTSNIPLTSPPLSLPSLDQGNENPLRKPPRLMGCADGALTHSLTLIHRLPASLMTCERFEREADASSGGSAGPSEPCLHSPSSASLILRPSSNTHPPPPLPHPSSSRTFQTPVQPPPVACACCIRHAYYLPPVRTRLSGP